MTLNSNLVRGALTAPFIDEGTDSPRGPLPEGFRHEMGLSQP